MSAIVTVVALNSLLESAHEMANKRDGKALRSLGIDVVKTSAKWASKLLIIRYEDVKDIKEALETIADVVEGATDVGGVRKSSRLRRTQVDAASDFLSWIDSLALLAAAWCGKAQQYILAVTGSPTVTDEDASAAASTRIRRHMTIRW
jgi:hypothetical protein